MEVYYYQLPIRQDTLKALWDKALRFFLHQTFYVMKASNPIMFSYSHYPQVYFKALALQHRDLENIQVTWMTVTTHLKVR